MGGYSNKFLIMKTKFDEFSFIEKIKVYLETNEKVELNVCVFFAQLFIFIPTCKSLLFL